MSATGLAAFDATIQTTHVWLNDICEEMGWGRDPHRAYRALRAVLHALRDRLPPNEAADLAAQLPLLIRGVYYEGWHPVGKPVKTHSLDEFLAPVAAAFRDDPQTPSAEVARVGFRVLTRRVSVGEIQDVIGNLPADVQDLWA